MNLYTYSKVVKRCMVSSKDVAQIAKVSQATVSRVLNNPESVKDKTRERVMKAITELGYHPNLIARSLVTNSTSTIALISGPLKNGFFVETTDRIINLAMKLGFKTMVYFEDSAEMGDIFQSIMGNKVDGILLSSIKLNDPLQEIIEQSGIPYMYFNRRPQIGGNYVVIENLLAGEIIARHLLELGHCRIAYISGRINVSTFYERQVGLIKVLNQENIYSSDLIFYTDTTASEVEEITLRLLKMDKPPTAIVCATDAMALICMETLLAQGLSIPADISLAGIDNIQISSHSAIRLTTVGIKEGSLGEIAAANLFGMIASTKHNTAEVNTLKQKMSTCITPEQSSLKQIVLQPVLIQRGTTGRATK